MYTAGNFQHRADMLADVSHNLLNGLHPMQMALLSVAWEVCVVGIAGYANCQHPVPRGVKILTA